MTREEKLQRVGEQFVQVKVSIRMERLRSKLMFRELQKALPDETKREIMNRVIEQLDQVDTARLAYEELEKLVQGRG